MYFYLLIVLGFFAIGDILGVATKAKLSSVFVALFLFLVGFIAQVLPPDIIDQANLTGIGSMSMAFVVFNMGTAVNLGELRREWKVVVMSIFAMVVAMVSIMAIIPIIGKQAAIVSIPIVNGGIVATQIMTGTALDKGFTIAAALGTIIFAVQKFVGTVPASRFGLKEADLLLVDYRANLAKGIDLLDEEATNENPKAPKKVYFYQKYDKYFTPYTILAVIALFAYIAYLIGEFTGISMSIWCLILGATAGYIGIVPPKILDKGKASGLFLVATFCTLIPSLAKISISDIKTLSFQTFAVFAAVLIGSYIFLYLIPTWKFIGSKNMAMGIAMSQLLGFPATFLIVNEIATALAKTEKEKDYVIKKLTPAFVVSGFVSVTTFSIIIAGIFSKFL